MHARAAAAGGEEGPAASRLTPTSKVFNRTREKNEPAPRGSHNAVCLLKYNYLSSHLVPFSKLYSKSLILPQALWVPQRRPIHATYSSAVYDLQYMLSERHRVTRRRSLPSLQVLQLVYRSAYRECR